MHSFTAGAQSSTTTILQKQKIVLNLLFTKHDGVILQENRSKIFPRSTTRVPVDATNSLLSHVKLFTPAPSRVKFYIKFRSNGSLMLVSRVEHGIPQSVRDEERGRRRSINGNEERDVEQVVP